MTQIESLEPAIDPNNRISFLLDWELTMKCNLDCDYCGSGLYAGHDNSTSHPPVQKCLEAIDFMFEYANAYIQTKPQGIKYVILNVYGGESLHHPNIVEILNEIQKKYQSFSNNWHLTVTTTTNAIVSEKKLQQIIPLIDEFTVSYHAQNTAKQKAQFQQNLLAISAAGRRQKCVIMMDPKYFQDCQDMIEWCQTNHIRYFPKQIDEWQAEKRIYQPEQIKWFNTFYSKNSFGQSIKIIDDQKESPLSDVGRACCGGRQLCVNQDYKQRQSYVENKFYDWYCSVNHFFLFVKQVTGEIFVNKDCKMNFQGSVGPIGRLDEAELVLNTLKNQLENKSLPVIQCKKSKCHCGLCAPKAKNLDNYLSLFKKYQLS